MGTCSTKQAESASIKCCAVGDGAVGKTCLLISYTTNEFPEKYVPTVFENYLSKITLGKREVELDLRDTAGQEDFDRLRHLSYPDTHVFLICFSVGHYTSYENVRTKWVTEIRHHCPNARFLIVGTKTDLRDDPNAKGPMVSKKDGEKLAKEVGAAGYMEVSALKRTGIQELFEEIARQGLKAIGE